LSELEFPELEKENRPLAKVNDAVKMRYEKIKGKSLLELE